MKKILNSLFIMAAVTAMFSVTSCTKTCDLGYEGSDCKTETRAKYLGNFNGTEVSTLAGTGPVSVNATSVNGDVTKVNFYNIYDAGFNTTATLQADGSLNIATQSFGTGQISGSAVITGGKVKITYTITAGGTADACTWTQN